MASCAVAICTNTWYNSKQKGIVFHVFPKDPALAKQWEIKCKRLDPINKANAKVCSDHFTRDDYQRDLKSELLGLTSKRNLKHDAKPSLLLLPSKTASVSTSKRRKDRSNDRGFKKFRSEYVAYDVEIRSAYRMATEKSNVKLKEVEDMVSSMRCLFWSKKEKKLVPRAGLLPCQTGLLVSIRSLFGMLDDLKKLYNVTYIKTKYINQDTLESHFSEVRALGRTNDNPTRLEFRHRLKLLLMGAKVSPPVSANVQVDVSNANYMSRQLLERATVEKIFEVYDFEFNQEFELELEFESESMDPDFVSQQGHTDDVVTKASLKYLAGYIGFLIKKSGGTDYGEITRSQPLHTLPITDMENIVDYWIHTL